jgi:hypothetical protein
MSYYINLSFLSNKSENQQKRKERRKLLSAEAKRILFLSENITQSDIKEEAGGRPFLPGQNMDFSISHSGNLAAFSVVKGKNIRTGCDVEFVRPRSKAREIAETLFSADEREYIEAQGRFDTTRFYHIWTLKECFLKLKGLSVFDMAGAPSFISGKDSFFLGEIVSSPLSFTLFELTGGGGEHYVLAAAVKGIEVQPEIRWFSQVSLDCKSIAKIKAALSPAQTVSPKI